MNSWQKVIKYLAIALAVLLIFNIVMGIIYGINLIGGAFLDKDVSNSDLKRVSVSDDYNILDIEVTDADIVIKEGNDFRIEKSDDNIRVKEIGNKLLITEKSYGLLESKRDSELIVYVPISYLFDEVSIESGAGRVFVDGLNAKELELDLGTGKVNLNKLNVSKEMAVDSGAGEVIIDNGVINNLELDMGVGRVELNVVLRGKNEIDSGIGEASLVLGDSSDNYKINVNKGVGKILVSGQEMMDDSYYGDGDNIIGIDGGIGNISVDFRK